MKACLLRSPAPVETNPLEYTDVPDPSRAPEEVLVRVKVCGVCRTDLHVVEGELPPRKSPVIPGHQVVGVIEKLGPRRNALPTGARVGIPGCTAPISPASIAARGRKISAITPPSPDTPSMAATPNTRSLPRISSMPFPNRSPTTRPRRCCVPESSASVRLRLSGVKKGGRLAFYGFGAAAHVAIQVARHWGVEVYASTRGEKHQQLALQLGAVWAGEATDAAPARNSMPRLSSLLPASLFRPL